MNRILFLAAKQVGLWAILVILLGWPSRLQAQVMTTFAGNGVAGYGGDGAQAVSARLNSPASLGIDYAGNIYISDQLNNGIRKVTPNGIITTVVGTLAAGYNGDGIPATSARLNSNWGVAVDSAGNIFIADQQNHRIRKVGTDGIIRTIAGTGTPGFLGDGGYATAAQLRSPLGIAVDKDGNLYVSDTYNNRIRKITAGPTPVISTIAGNGSYGFSGDGGAATAASVKYVWGLATDNDRNVYICDGENHRVRKINRADGIISTVAGSGVPGFGGDGGDARAARLNRPLGICIDRCGDMLIADCQNNRVRKVSAATNVITTVAGNGVAAFSGDDDLAINASLNQPIGVVADWDKNIYISDLVNARVREVVKKLSYTHCPYQTITVCKNAANIPVDEYLEIRDMNLGLSDNWALLQEPKHGTAAVSYSIPSVPGVKVRPSGLYYTPSGLFTGKDTFSVQVSNGIFSDVAYICLNIDSFLITAGELDGPDALCAGSSIQLLPSKPGGSWTTVTANAAVTAGRVTGITAGADTIQYTINNACGNAVAQHAVTVYALPETGTITGPASLCVGDTATVSSSVVGGTWQGVPGVLALAVGQGFIAGILPGYDTVAYRVTNANCSDAARLPVQVLALPSVPVIAATGKLLSVPAGYTSYQWYLNGVPITTATGNHCAADTIGKYTVRITNEAGCAAVTGVYEYNTCDPADMVVYPVPTATTVLLNWCKPVTVRVIAADGRVCATLEQVNKIDLEQLPAGMYLLELFDGAGNRIAVKKVVKW